MYQLLDKHHTLSLSSVLLSSRVDSAKLKSYWITTLHSTLPVEEQAQVWLLGQGLCCGYTLDPASLGYVLPTLKQCQDPGPSQCWHRHSWGTLSTPHLDPLLHACLWFLDASLEGLDCLLPKPQ